MKMDNGMVLDNWYLTIKRNIVVDLKMDFSLVLVRSPIPMDQSKQLLDRVIFPCWICLIDLDMTENFPKVVIMG